LLYTSVKRATQDDEEMGIHRVQCDAIPKKRLEEWVETQDFRIRHREKQIEEGRCGTGVRPWSGA